MPLCVNWSQHRFLKSFVHISIFYIKMLFNRFSWWKSIFRKSLSINDNEHGFSFGNIIPIWCFWIFQLCVLSWKSKGCWLLAIFAFAVQCFGQIWSSNISESYKLYPKYVALAFISKNHTCTTRSNFLHDLDAIAKINIRALWYEYQ